MTLKICQLTEYYIMNIFIENHAENMHQKLVQDPFLIVINNAKQPLDARNSFKNKIC